MDQRKINERIAMAMLRQCALVWEHCARLGKKVTSCELKFNEVRYGTGNYKMWKKCPIDMIELNLDKCEHRDVFIRKMQEVPGVEDFRFDSRWSMVKMFFQTDDHDPNMGFGCSYPVDSVFATAYEFCTNNGLQSLLNKAVFGMDGNGKYARLPEVDVTQKAQKPRKANVAKKQVKAGGAVAAIVQPHAKQEPTLADRLREALRKQLQMAA